MALRIDLRVRLGDPAVGTDDVGDAPGGPRLRRIGRSVRHADLSVRVAEEREGIFELPREGVVLGGRVERNAPDLGVLLLEFRIEVAEPATRSEERRVGKEW